MSSGHRLHYLRALSEPSPVAALPDLSSNGIVAAEVSNAIVQLLRKVTGSVPGQAQTVLTSELAVVTLGGCLTTAERTLLDEGESALVTEVRSVLHSRLRAQATEAVEQITGRPVLAYLTAQEHDPDLTIISFVFALPPGSPGP